MARKVTTVLIDDLTGEDADETVEFGIDGKFYEIELTADNASRLRELLGNYVKVARRAESPASAGRKRAGKKAGRSDLTEIRDWARSHGYDVSDRGRIRAEIIEAYDKAH
ncbi:MULTISPECIES: histone-like nucleoid-structuring protein Lsr2 [unclassified Brevibacterium]|uniref:histone-like nucleoid-structuring protein Lsr2 n=1 Tax=unclassified Brevibacterium TaxID=2614124 RepID=UPI0008A2AB01|nr:MULTISPECIES: Lsr2 family protein [unclassified Brevibacterium]OFL66379.1 hypothetical protein HMPREF2757_03160 [Brevibacterium sp. HMSC063G07]OFS27773.1 hypothetical protein HMPREF3162_00835 [Brevibacterium sp. HMSC07C04]